MNSGITNSPIRQWFIDQALNHSKRTIILSIIATLIMGSGVRFLIIDDDMMKMLPKDLNSKITWDAVQDEFGSTEIIFIAFGREGESVFKPQALADLWSLSEELETLSSVDDVTSISTSTRIDNIDGFMEIDDLQSAQTLTDAEIDEIKIYLDKNTNIKKQLVSNKEDYLLTIVQPYDDVGLDTFRNDIVTAADAILNNYQIHFGGTAYVTGSVPQLIREDVQSLIKVGILIMVVILLLNLRSLPGVIMVLMVIGFSLVSMMGFMGWVYYLTETPRFSFSMVNTSMPIVLLTIANSDGVHILSRFFREARKHKDVKKALTMTMNQLMLPVFLTSITTTAAFLTMVSSPIATMTGYGTTIGFGIMWAWVLSSTYLPAIIHLKKWDMNKAAIDQPSFLEKLIHRFGRSLLNYPKQVFLTGFLIVAVSSIGIWFINVEVNIINLFKPGHEIRESTLFLDREMAGSMNLILKVEGDLKDPEVLNKMIDIQDYISAFPTVNTTFSIADVIKEMHKSIMDNDPAYETIPDTRGKINNLFTMYSMSGDPDDFEALVDYEYETGLITAMMQSVSTKEIVIMADQIEVYIEEMGTEEFTTETSGMMMFLKDFTTLIVQSSLNSILLSIVIILFIT